jgi:hypothetical protein
MNIIGERFAFGLTLSGVQYTTLIALRGGNHRALLRPLAEQLRA